MSQLTIFYRYHYNYFQSRQLCLANDKQLIGIKGLIQLLHHTSLKYLNKFFIAESSSNNSTTSCVMAAFRHPVIKLERLPCASNVIVCENTQISTRTITIAIICILVMLMICLCVLALIINTGQRRRRQQRTLVIV